MKGAMARHVVLACLVLSALATGCRHTERVGEPAPEATAEPSKKETRVPPRDGRPGVAADPSGLMRAGSAKRIEEALRSKGYLRESSAKASANELTTEATIALRRFQRDEGLAATGAPDRETLRRLGIDPQDVYSTARRGASDSAGEGTGSVSPGAPTR